MSKCTYEVRPGLIGIIDHLDHIDTVKHKATALFSLLSSAADNKHYDALTNDELGDLGWLLRDLLAEVWQAGDGIYEIYKAEEKLHG